MNWIPLTDAAQLNDIKEKSKQTPQVIFKHSTRCSISSMAKGRLDRGSAPQNTDFYFLDLISNRKVSDEVAREFDVDHESPQVLVISNGKCVYDESHSSINMDEIKETITF